MVEVRVEITASVWQVVVVEGQEVAAGDPIVVLESMKMEIPVEAPVAGRVVQVVVSPEDQVAEGDLVAVIE